MNLSKALTLIATVALAVPTQAQPAACYDPLKPMLRTELFFGRNADGRQNVCDREWARFLTHEQTPRFPEKLTMIDGWDQRRHGDTGHVMRESGKVIVIQPACAAFQP